MKNKLEYKLIIGQTLFVLFLVFSIVNTAVAQKATSAAENQREESLSTQSLTPNFTALTKGTGIWSGTAFFSRNKSFMPSYGPSGQRNIEKNIHMNFGVDAEYVRLFSPKWGVGLKGFFETVFSEKFKSAKIAYLGAGPVLRGYFIEKEKFMGYGQTNFLLGYDMARKEPLYNMGSEFTYRTELRVGASYRLSNSFGVFLNAGPDWGGGKNDFGYQRFQLHVGIQLFRF